MQHIHEHKFQTQPIGGLTLRQFIESLRRWTPEMRHIAQIAVTRTEAERQDYLRSFHANHHEREPGKLDSFVRWAYSDPRLEYIPQLIADNERPESDYEGALRHEADVLVQERARGRTPAQRVADYMNLLGIENSEQVRNAIARLLPEGTTDAAVLATIRDMRRAWLERFGDDPFFAED
jgi:hypothetical protein